VFLLVVVDVTHVHTDTSSELVLFSFDDLVVLP
jgi:hypothetical protein